MAPSAEVFWVSPPRGNWTADCRVGSWFGKRAHSSGSTGQTGISQARQQMSHSTRATPDRRRHLRRAVAIPAWVKCDGTVQEVEIRSISWGGALLVSNERARLGAVLLIAPKGLGRRPPILTARVRYQKDSGRSGGCTIGVCWIAPADCCSRGATTAFLDHLLRTGELPGGTRERENVPDPRGPTGQRGGELAQPRCRPHGGPEPVATRGQQVDDEGRAHPTSRHIERTQRLKSRTEEAPGANDRLDFAAMLKTLEDRP